MPAPRATADTDSPRASMAARNTSAIVLVPLPGFLMATPHPWNIPKGIIDYQYPSVCPAATAESIRDVAVAARPVQFPGPLLDQLQEAVRPENGEPLPRCLVVHAEQTPGGPAVQ